MLISFLGWGERSTTPTSPPALPHAHHIIIHMQVKKCKVSMSLSMQRYVIAQSSSRFLQNSHDHHQLILIYLLLAIFEFFFCPSRFIRGALAVPSTLGFRLSLFSSFVCLVTSCCWLIYPLVAVPFVSSFASLSLIFLFFLACFLVERKRETTKKKRTPSLCWLWQQTPK